MNSPELSEQIERAVKILKGGGLVAFPTETVYGLGADATQPAAVRKIFAAKGRPAGNPLIVHVADIATAQKFAGAWPESAAILSRNLWPGPLSLIVTKSAAIASEVAAGGNTVALRVPDHPIALKLLAAFGGAVAAPSANRSTRVSPTTAAHVQQELGDSVDLILDGGACRVGIESTVLDLSAEKPRLLRPGAVSRETIERLIGPVEVFSGSVDSKAMAASPGLQAVHYSPHTPAIWFDPADHDAVTVMFGELRAGKAAVIYRRGLPLGTRLQQLAHGEAAGAMPDDPEDYAQQLYATLRKLDARNFSQLWIELPPDAPQWLAIRDRILRAARAR